MRFYIPVFATEVKEENTLYIHGIPNQRFANKEEAEAHYKIKPWGSVQDYRIAKSNGVKIKHIIH